MKNQKQPKIAKMPKTKREKFYRFCCYTAASGFGIGYIPIASDTIGSLAALPFAFLAAYFLGFLGILLFSILTIIIGVISSREVLKQAKHDPSVIIVDKVAGQFITFLFIADALQNNLSAWPAYVLGLFLFRLFDILKPEPAKWVNTKFLNAWGIMSDDVFSGLYAGIVLYVTNIYVRIL